MERKARQIGRKGKDVSMRAVPVTAAPDLDTRVALIPVALDKVHEALKEEGQRLAGDRYAGTGRQPGHVRWTPQPGSIYLADQKIPIQVPRVRDRLRNREVPLQTYERFQQPRALDTGLLHKVLGGLSTREYERCAEAVPEAFGLSASTVVAAVQAGERAQAPRTERTAARAVQFRRQLKCSQDLEWH